MAKKPQHAQNNQRSQQGKQGQQQKRGGKARRPRHSYPGSARPSLAPGPRQVPPRQPRRYGRARLGPVRLRLHLRRRYVDHPSFGMAIVSRVLDAHGYKVGIICQPDSDRPRQHHGARRAAPGFLVSAGNMDSMVNHYSVTKHRRHTDAYTPGGEEGHRPNRAVTVYGNLIRQTFKDAPIIIGGIEASLRRLATTTTGRTNSSARCCSTRAPTSSSTAWASTRSSRSPTRSTRDCPWTRSPISTAPSTAPARSTSLRLRPAAQLGRPCRRQAQLRAQLNVQQQNMDPSPGHRLVEPYPNSVYVVQNPPSATLTTDEMDEVAELPYARDWHPDYDTAGGVRPLRDQVFDQLQPRVLWRVLVLRADLPPGSRAADAQPRLDHARGRAAHARSRV